MTAKQKEQRGAGYSARPHSDDTAPQYSGIIPQRYSDRQAFNTGRPDWGERTVLTPEVERVESSRGSYWFMLHVECQWCDETVINVLLSQRQSQIRMQMSASQSATEVWASTSL